MVSRRERGKGRSVRKKKGREGEGRANRGGLKDMEWQESSSSEQTSGGSSASDA